MRRVGERWACEWCGQSFARNRSGARPIRFCGQPCYHAWNRARGSGEGRFPKGNEPWNRGLKGIHLSPASEFAKGQRTKEPAPIGCVRVRVNKRDQRPRAYVKVGHPNVWRLRAVVVWESIHGPIPDGSVVHHRDRDTLNDAPENLERLTRAEHLAEHRRDHEERRRERAAEAAHCRRRSRSSSERRVAPYRDQAKLDLAGAWADG